MAKQFEVLRLLAANPAAPFTRRDALVAANGALDKLSDIKLRGPAAELLFACAEAAGTQWLSALVHKKASAHKNPKAWCRARPNWERLCRSTA
jgi:hypothetical protein